MDNDDLFAHETLNAKRVERVLCAGIEVKTGDHVRLRPMGRADVLDIALDGMMATVVAIEQDYEDRIHLAVTVDDDPGNDLGAVGKPAHRFFFGIDEVEPARADTEIEAMDLIKKTGDHS